MREREAERIFERDLEGITGGYVCLSHKGAKILLFRTEDKILHEVQHPKHNIQQLDLIPHRIVIKMLMSARTPLRAKAGSICKEEVAVSTLPKPRRNRALGHKVKVWSTR